MLSSQTRGNLNFPRPVVLAIDLTRTYSSRIQGASYELPLLSM